MTDVDSHLAIHLSDQLESFFHRLNITLNGKPRLR